MSVLAPEQLSIQEDVLAGDEAFNLTRDGTCIAVGRVKVDAAKAEGMKKGQIVRTRRNIAYTIVPGAPAGMMLCG